tara:strand:- start:367 stop:870 length:504 start_codon:yes stop_codon:yes gene_type:complete
MLVTCLNCNIEFEKTTSAAKRSPNHFCCRSCACSYNNSKSPKRSKQGKCKKCEIPINTSHTYCKKCWEEHPMSGSDWMNDESTLEQIMYHRHHKSSAFGLVRHRARAIAKKLGWNSCCKCGYSKHIEIAHIKPVSSFPLNTKLKIVNSVDNIIPLCPNCHWEFDHPS